MARSIISPCRPGLRARSRRPVQHGHCLRMQAIRVKPKSGRRSWAAHPRPSPTDPRRLARTLPSRTASSAMSLARNACLGRFDRHRRYDHRVINVPTNAGAKKVIVVTSPDGNPLTRLASLRVRSRRGCRHRHPRRSLLRSASRSLTVLSIAVPGLRAIHEVEDGSVTSLP